MKGRSIRTASSRRGCSSRVNSRSRVDSGSKSRSESNVVRAVNVERSKVGVAGNRPRPSGVLLMRLGAPESPIMDTTLFFPFASYWWLYAGFTGFVLLLLALDLGVFHRTAHVVSFREAAAWSVVWVSLALVFNYGFYLYALNTFPGNERLLAVPGFDPAAAAQAGRPRVPHRLHRREVAGGGQHLRVRRRLQLLRGAGHLPAPGALLRHHRRPAVPGDLHRHGLDPDAVPLGRDRVRAVPDPHRREDVLRAGEGDPPGEEPGDPAVQAVRAGDARDARAALLREASTAGSGRRRCSWRCCSSR